MRLPRPKLAHLIYLAVIYVAILAAASPLRSYDLWWHVQTGRWIFAHHQVPASDPFSYTSGSKPWIAHEWAFDILLAFIHDNLGLLGLIYFKTFIASVALVLLAWLCRRWQTSSLLMVLVLGGATICMIPWLNARPQIMLILFVVILLHILRSYQEGRHHAAWWLPLLFVVWVNFHGGFLIGFVIIAIFALGYLVDSAGLHTRRGLPAIRLRPLATLAAAACLALLATLLNPHGLTGALYPLQYLWGSCTWHQDVITEYASPNFHKSYLVYIEIYMLVALLALILSPVAPSVWPSCTFSLNGGAMLRCWCWWRRP